MDSLNTITKLVTREINSWHPSTWKIPITLSLWGQDIESSCVLEWDRKLFQFTCLPNGLSNAPRKFTKILKPPLAELLKRGHISLAHLDDLYLQGQTNEQCILNVTDTVLLLHSLGFVVHPRKSSLIPSQEIVILGFIINSVAMTVRLTQDKLASLISSCNNLLRCLSPTIREVARVVGKLVSSLPGVRYGPLYYRHLERDKCLALKIQKGNFDQHMSLSTEAKSELHWWVNNVQNAYNPILLLQPQHTITNRCLTVRLGGSIWRRCPPVVTGPLKSLI